MSERKRLTETLVKKAEPKGRDYQVFDDLVSGFALVVYRSGSRSFALNYRQSGRLRRYTIGRWPEWGVAMARARAAELRRDIEAGLDPMADRRVAQDAADMKELIDMYVDEHIPRLSKRNGRDQASVIETFVRPQWGKRLVSSITERDVELLLNLVASGKLSKKKRAGGDVVPTPTRANRVGEIVRTMFDLGIAAKMITENPARNFRRREEVERERYLTLDELGRLSKALEAVKDQTAADVVRMLMLSGARKGEVCQARFEDFNLDLLAWKKQAATTKQRRIHRVPISEALAVIIRRRRVLVPEGCPWLFPIRDGSTYIKNIDWGWAKIKKAAELSDLRLHDLRHTFASLLISEGSSLEMIGGLLGHSNTRTTQRYAHLMDSPLRAGVDSVAARLQPRLRVIDGGG